MDYIASPRGEVNFKVRHQDYEFKHNIWQGRSQTLLMAMQVPLLLEIRSRKGIRGMFGPALEFPLVGKSEAHVTRITTGEQATQTSAIKKDMRSLTVAMLGDLGFAFPNGLALSLRSDMGISNMWTENTGRRATRVSHVLFSLEYDSNALARQQKAVKRE